MQNKKKIPPFKHSNQVNVYCYKNFEPVIYDAGEGFEADLLKAIFHLWEVEYKFHPSDDYEKIWLKPGETGSIFDIAAGGIDPKVHQDDKVLYSASTAKYSQSLLILKQNFTDKIITGYKSFATGDKKIGVIGNTTGETYGKLRAEENELPFIIFKRFETEDDMLSALMNGEIQAIARGSMGNEYQEMKNDKLLTIEKKSFGETIAFALNPKNIELRDSLNDAIKFITKQYTISYKEWLNDPKIFLASL